MGVFISNAITDRGRILLGEAQVGATFEATRIVMGSGYIPAGYTARTMTAVVAPVIELAINKKRRAGDGTVTFGGVYSNETITEAFYFREFALYARVEYANGTYSDEVLYSYGNAGDNADLMPAYSMSTVVEKQMDLVTWVGNDTAVNLTIASGLYIPMEEKGQPYGVPTLNEGGDMVIHDGIGTVGANSNMTVLAHRLDKDGPARYIAVSMENELENAARLTEELEGGGSVSYDLIHTGMENPAKTIGAFPGTKLLTNRPDANELTTEGNYFLMNGLNIPKDHGFVTVMYFDGASFAPDLAWGRTHCIRQIYRDYNGTMICERIGLLKAEISDEWEWGEWDDLLRSSGGTMKNRLWLGNGMHSGYGAIASNDKEVHITAFSEPNNSYSAYTNLVVNNGADVPDGQRLRLSIDSADGENSLRSYFLLHTGNAPAVIATAELV